MKTSQRKAKRTQEWLEQRPGATDLELPTATSSYTRLGPQQKGSTDEFVPNPIDDRVQPASTG